MTYPEIDFLKLSKIFKTLFDSRGNRVMSIKN